MRVLVIGGTGFIGPHVVRQLSESGHEVTVFHSGQHEADLPAQVRHVHASSPTTPGFGTQVPAHADELRRLAPDAVLFMVPIGEEDARAVVRVFSGFARRLVAISSVDVYRAYGRFIGGEPGLPDAVPLQEDSPLREKLYPYRGETPRPPGDPRRWMDDYDKILVERIVIGDARMPGTVLRLPAVYGPGDRQHRLFPYLKRMDDRRPAIVLEEGIAGWRWSRAYVENVGAAIALAVSDDRAAGRIYNVAEVEAPTEAEWVREIGDASGWGGEIAIVPSDQLPDTLKQPYHGEQDLTADSRRLRAELGYREVVPRDVALRRTIQWERENPPAQIDPAEFDYAAEDAVLAKRRD